MNYRHAYHAGNFADVVKHAVLALVIEHLKLKPAPFRVIDTHAGIGVYDLASEPAQKTGEWREGIGRVMETRLFAGGGGNAGAVSGCRPAAQRRRADGALSRQPAAGARAVAQR